MKKEYRNEKKYKSYNGHNYEAELWIDGKYIMPVTLSEVTYRYDVLMNKLETLLDKETFNEVKEVMELTYKEGSDNAHEEYAGFDL